MLYKTRHYYCLLTYTVLHVPFIVHDISNNATHTLENLFIITCPGWGLNSIFWDCKPACYQMSHPFLYCRSNNDYWNVKLPLLNETSMSWVDFFSLLNTSLVIGFLSLICFKVAVRDFGKIWSKNLCVPTRCLT